MKYPAYTLLVFLILAVAISSCKKEKSIINTPPSGPVQLWNGVRVVDSTQWILKSVSGGMYDFTFTSRTGNIDVKPGDVIIGLTGDGYLRKVTSIALTNSDMILSTNPADMSDVFKSGGFNFQLDMGNVVSGSPEFLYNFSDKTIYQNGSFTVKLLNGVLNMNPNWFFNFSFDSTAGINDFEMSTKDASIHESFTFNIVALQTANLGDYNPRVASFTKKYIQWVNASGVSIPVVVVMDVDLYAHIDASINYTNSSQGTFTADDSFGLGFRYSNNQWGDNYNPTITKTIHMDSVNGEQTVLATVGLRPRISVKLYGVECPNASVELRGTLFKRHASSQDWNLRVDDWVNSSTGANGTILGKTLWSFSKSYTSDSSGYYTPKLITKISGDNQFSSMGQALPDPITVRVLDSNGNPQAGVWVHYNITSGQGTINPPNVYTGADGYAQATWTMGLHLGTQTLSAIVNSGYSNPINGAPVNFTARAQ